MTINQTPSVPDPWSPSPEPKIDQSAEDTQGSTQQQAVVGDNNNQKQRQNVEVEKVNYDNQDKVSPDVQIIGQQGIDGNHNNQNQNQVVVNILDKDFSFLGKDASTRAEHNQVLPDPTKPLPQKPKNLPEVKLSELLDYCKKLQEDSLVVLTCSDSSTAFSVAYNLADNTLASSKRLFTGEWGNLTKLAIEPSVNIVLNSEIGEGVPTLIVVDTYEMQTFLDSLVVQPSTAALIQDDLKRRQRLCICLAESKVLETTLDRKQIKLSFPRWEIPFEKEEVSQNVQREPDYPEQAISSYKDGQSAVSLYEASNAITKTVLYVGTFFQNLNINDFDRIVSLLLADQTILVESENKIDTLVNTESTVSVTVGDQIVTFNQSQKAQPDRSYNLPKTQVKKSLRNIWEEDAEQILKSCFLELSVNKYNSRVIDFSLPHLRDELKQYFEETKFIEYRNKFRKLTELNLMFDRSSQVTKSFKDLSVAMMIFQPGVESWVDWLTEIVMKVLEFNTEINKKDLDYIYSCIADLLRETLNYPQLEDFVKFFMNQLISLKQHNIVLSLSKRLRFAPQFDEYYWLEQSINRGSDDVRIEAYQILYEQTKQSGSQIYEILEKVNAWLPDLERDPEKYSFSNKYALQLLLQYSIETLYQFDPKQYGDDVFNYPLFGGLRYSESVDARLNMIVEWLLHPGINSILDVDMDVDSLAIVSILVFPSLFTILFGLKEEISVKPEFSNIAATLVQTIKNVIKTYEKKKDIKYNEKIIEYWELLSSYLLQASSYEIKVNKNWEQGDNFNYRQNIIDYLIEKIEA